MYLKLSILMCHASQLCSLLCPTRARRHQTQSRQLLTTQYDHSALFTHIGYCNGNIFRDRMLLFNKFCMQLQHSIVWLRWCSSASPGGLLREQ